MDVKKFALQLSLITFVWTNCVFSGEFISTPPAKFTLDPKNIALHHPVKTDQLAAQLYFDQGLTQLYAFDNDTAYWSFLNASKIDPQMPMAYWGMAIALIPNLYQMPMPSDINKVAYDAIQKALDLSTGGSEIEREYIEALSKRYVNNSDPALNTLAYSQQMEKLHNRYPDDPDAAVLFAVSLLDLQESYWDKEGKPYPGILEAVNTLETVMKAHPNHVGANHYYIHTMDGSPFPEKALRSAERLKTLLPNAGHLLHMPSHIYLLVGDYHEAALCSEEALAADREYVNTYGMEGFYPFSYMTHTLYFLTRIYSLEERFREAMWAANQLQQLYLPRSKQMPQMEYYVVMPLFVLVHFHEWEKILKFPAPSEEMPLATLLWHFSRTMAFASMKNSSEASKESQLFEVAKKQVFEDPRFQNETAKEMIPILDYLMKAKTAENEGQTDQAIKILQQAVNEQDTVSFNESPVYFISARQQLGALFLNLGQHKEAERTYREDLEKIPNTSRSLFGLKESLKAQSKLYDLFWVDQAFQQAFKYSDINFTKNNL